MNNQINIYAYDNIIFDYGGIIVNLESDYITKTFTKIGVSRLTLWWKRRRLKQLVREFINGLRPTDEITDEILHVVGSVSRDKLTPVLASLAGDLPKERLQMIMQLRKTHRIFLLSNINDLLWENAEKDMLRLGYQPDKLFDAIFLSYKMHTAKPDTQIYQRVIDEAKIDPLRTLFFDDRKENVEAACKLGIHGVLVETNNLENYLTIEHH